MESPHTGRMDSWKFDSPISIEGAELQESMLIAELPSDAALSVVRAYRLALAWPKGPQAMDRLTDAQGLAEWEEDALSRLDADLAVWAPIAVIAGELQDPGTADADRLAYACLAIAEWAISIGAGATAILFVEAAALVNPFNPRHAYLAGKVLCERGRMREAERWLRRAIRLAAGTHDDEVHAMGVEALRGVPGTSDEQ
jgi:tetratricopeptide (TPR) repeat protein